MTDYDPRTVATVTWLYRGLELVLVWQCLRGADAVEAASLVTLTGHPLLAGYWTGYVVLGRECPAELCDSGNVHGGVTWEDPERGIYGWDAAHYQSPRFTQEEAQRETERLAAWLLASVEAA